MTSARPSLRQNRRAGRGRRSWFLERDGTFRLREISSAARAAPAAMSGRMDHQLGPELMCRVLSGDVRIPTDGCAWTLHDTRGTGKWANRTAAPRCGGAEAQLRLCKSVRYR